MTITDKIVPGMVGVDIGCGMETVRLDVDSLDFEQLDEIIHKYVPSGFDVRRAPHKYADEIDLSELRCARRVNLDRAYKSVGTLGGGNHFIEVDRAGSGGIYIVVHSGSRHLGCEVADYYQTEGYNALRGCAQSQIEEAIAQLKAEGRQKEIQSTMKRLKEQTAIPVPKDLAYVEGSLFDDYVHDMKIMQRFAVLNRKAMIDTILVGMRLSAAEEFTTIHNYIDTDSMILRKGAVSAEDGEKLLIPINMRDGSLVCIGKGNPDWNASAPHGAGRIMSRGKAFHELTMEQYKVEMRGIYSTCVLPETLDESPMAYKPIDEIISRIAPTAEIVARIKPLYNFKAVEVDKWRRG
jgi:RNA-splicing ligase RtcB